MSAYNTSSENWQYYFRLSAHNSSEDGLIWDNANNAWKRYEIRGGASAIVWSGRLSGYAWWNRVVFGTQNSSPVNNAGGAYNFNTPSNGFPYISQIETARPTTFGGSVLYERAWRIVRDFKIGTDLRTIRVDDHNNIYNVAGANTAIFDAHGEHRFQGVFAQATIRPFEIPLDITGGLRGDFWQTTHGLISGTSLVGAINNPLPNQSYKRLNPRLGLRYTFLRYLGIRGAICRNFSAPGMNQMYRSYTVNATFNNSSPGLIPETNFGQEAGLDFRWKNLDVAFTIFNNRLNNYIDYPVLCATLTACSNFVNGTGLAGITSVRQYLNVGSAVIKGGELLTTWRIRRSLVVDGGVTKTAAQLTSTLYPAASPIRSQIAQVPEWMGSGGLTWSPVPRLDLSMRVKIWSEYWNNTAHTVVNEAATITDVSAAFRFNRMVNFFATVQNAGNVAYYDQGAQGTATAPYRGQPFRLDVGVRLSLWR